MQSDSGTPTDNKVKVCELYKINPLISHMSNFPSSSTNNSGKITPKKYICQFCVRFRSMCVGAYCKWVWLFLFEPANMIVLLLMIQPHPLSITTALTFILSRPYSGPSHYSGRKPTPNSPVHQISGSSFIFASYFCKHVISVVSQSANTTFAQW